MKTIRITVRSDTPAQVVLRQAAPKNRDITTKLALLLKRTQPKKGGAKHDSKQSTNQQN